MIAAAPTILEAALTFGAVCGVLVGFFTVLEKITGFAGRWLASAVETGTRGLREDVNDLKADLKEHKTYTKYHLGPNGEAPKLHHRVESIEEFARDIKAEQTQVRRTLEAD